MKYIHVIMPSFPWKRCAMSSRVPISRDVAISCFSNAFSDCFVTSFLAMTKVEIFCPRKLEVTIKRFLKIIFLIVLMLIIFTPNVDAHRLQPAYLEINEQSAGKFNILWKRPYVGGRPMNISPQLPSGCSNLTDPVIQTPPTAAIERWLVDCGKSGITNNTIVIAGLSATQTDTLLRVQLIDGSMHTTVLRPESPSFIVPPQPSKAKV